MKKKDRTYRLFLEDMLLAMKRVAEYINGLSFIEFKHDYKTVDAVIRNFEVIGHTTLFGHLTPAFTGRNNMHISSYISWSILIGGDWSIKPAYAVTCGHKTLQHQ